MQNSVCFPWLIKHTYSIWVLSDHFPITFQSLNHRVPIIFPSFYHLQRFLKHMTFLPQSQSCWRQEMDATCMEPPRFTKADVLTASPQGTPDRRVYCCILLMIDCKCQYLYLYIIGYFWLNCYDCYIFIFIVIIDVYIVVLMNRMDCWLYLTIYYASNGTMYIVDYWYCWSLDIIDYCHLLTLYWLWLYDI